MQFLPMCEDISLGFIEILVDAGALDHVAGTAAGDQVRGILFALVSAGYDEINGHDQGIFEAGLTIQSAISAAVVVAFQNLEAFSEADGHGDPREGHEVERHVHLHAGRISTERQRALCRRAASHVRWHTTILKS